MTYTWPSTSWEIHKDYEATLSDGRSVVFRGMFHIFAEGEEAADVCAGVHLRLMLDLAGVPWREGVPDE